MIFKFNSIEEKYLKFKGQLMLNPDLQKFQFFRIYWFTYTYEEDNEKLIRYEVIATDKNIRRHDLSIDR